MICLAFEFTSDRRSVAVSDGARILAETVHDGGRQTPVFAMIDRVLSESGIGRDAVHRLAVSIGPGSYTGIRIAISAAQGWHLATGAEVVAVDTFEVLRLAAEARGAVPPWTFAVDAQRDEFAVRTCTADGWGAPVSLLGTAQLLEAAAAGTAVLGPDLRRLFPGPAQPGIAELAPTASDVLRAASGLAPVAPESLGPVYLREAAFVKAPPARTIPGITA
jgi:tRNA threonylcarbamoyl adenosine modification protein YeaZ